MAGISGQTAFPTVDTGQAIQSSLGQQQVAEREIDEAIGTDSSLVGRFMHFHP
jgi:hypothetical protein